MNPPLPSVSIVTVCYNSARTIRDTIESVLAQDFPRIEYIIVDGGSSDGTLDIIREYGDRISRVVSGPDRGIYDAMNKGIRLATGEVVGLLNSDDFYTDSTVITELMSAMVHAKVDSVFADLVYVDPHDVRKVQRYYNCKGWSPRRFRYGWMPAHPTYFIRREWYDRCGLFSLDYRIASDFEMLIRLICRGGATYTHVARSVVRMRAGGLSTRGIRHSLILNREIVRACRANGVWTMLPLVLMKAPAKIIETWRRPHRS